MLDWIRNLLGLSVVPTSEAASRTTILDQLLQTTQEGFWHIDSETLTIDVNPAMCRILGVDRDAVIGCSIYDFVDDANKQVFLRQIKARKQGATGGYQVSLRRADGVNIPCINNASPILNDAGERIGSIGLWTVIAEAEAYRRHTDAADHAIVIVTADRKVLYANPAALNLFGYPALDDIRALPTSLELIAPHDRDRATEARTARFAGTSSPELKEFDIARKDGHIMHTQVFGQLVEWEGQTCMEVKYVDITKRRQAEAALRANEEKFRAVLDHFPAAIFFKDTEGRYTFVNRNFEDWYNVESGDCIGKTPADYFSPEAAAIYQEHDRLVLSEGKIIEEEILVHYRDGQTRTVMIVKFPVADDAGKAIGLGSINLDITARREAEKQRQLALDNVPALIVHLDLEARYRFANKTCEVWYGRPAEDIIGKTVAEVLGGVAESHFMPVVQRAIAGEATAYETTVTYPDGITRSIHGNYTPHFDDAGNVAGVYAVIQDATALQRAKDQFRAVVDGSPTAITLKDLDGRILIMNRTLADWYDIDPEQAVGRTLAELGNTNISDDIKTRDQAIIESGEPGVSERTWRYHDGVTRTVLAHKRPIRSADGKIESVVTIATDITELKRVENQFRAIFDGSPAAITLKDRDGRFLMINNAYADWQNIDAEASIGHLAAETLPPAFVITVAELDRAVFESGEPSVVNNTVSYRDGVTRQVVTHRRPIRNDAGEIYAVATIINDVTDLIQAESQFRAVVDGSPAAITLKDRDSRFLVVNQTFAEWFGIDADDYMGKTTYDVQDKAFADKVVARDRQVFETGDDEVTDHVVHFPDGQSRHCLSQKRPIRLPSGEIFAIATIMTDVSDLKQAQAELIHAEKLATLGRMAAGITHELAQPLNIIRLSAQSAAMELADGDIDPSDLRVTLASIDDQVGRMAEIIDHMRIFARKDEAGSEVFDATFCVDRATGFMSQQLAAADCGLQTNLPEQAAMIAGSPVQLEQVLLNLITNAGDAIAARRRRSEPGDPPFEGRIGVDLAVNAETVHITIADNAGGIAEEALERIFDPFYTTKEIGAGTGLGLSVSSAIIESMGGSLACENRAGGACFTVSLPAANGSALAAPDAKHAGRAEIGAGKSQGEDPGTRGRRLMVVEDEDAAGGYLAKHLGKSGYEVIRAGNGAAALEAFNAAPVDIVITDLQMPVMDGEELIRRLRDRAPDLPIIVTTGKMAVGDGDEIIAEGATHVLKKPIDLRELAEKLNGLH